MRFSKGSAIVSTAKFNDPLASRVETYKNFRNPIAATHNTIGAKLMHGFNHLPL